MTAAAPDQIGAFGADVSSPYVPVGVTPRYPPPRANIRPDRRAPRGCGACCRSCSRTSGSSALAGRVVPRARRPGADPERGRPGDRRRGSSRAATSRTFVSVIVGARAACASSSTTRRAATCSRPRTASSTTCGTSCTSTSAACRSRSTTGCSRVSSSRAANSDIRQVQMYLAFAPIVFVQCSVAVLAFALMLTINVPLAFVAMSTMPFVVHRRRPHAAAHVPGVVADPGAPRRRRHRRRREHQRRARGQVVRGRGAPAAAS